MKKNNKALHKNRYVKKILEQVKLRRTSQTRVKIACLLQMIIFWESNNTVFST